MEADPLVESTSVALLVTACVVSVPPPTAHSASTVPTHPSFSDVHLLHTSPAPHDASPSRFAQWLAFFCTQPVAGAAASPKRAANSGITPVAGPLPDLPLRTACYLSNLGRVVPAVSSQVSASDDDALAAGSILDGRYRIVARLGGGAMGTVYRAEHLRVGREVAIKVLAHELAHDQDLRRRFEGEARAAAAAGHPGIVQILDAGTLEGGAPYLVMEHLRGRELYSELIEHGPMPLERACRLVRDLARAVHAAHEVGVVHRDLKPENIYVVDTPDGESVKVIDFGVAFRTDAEASRMTRPGIVVGTPHYMAPELLDGSAPTHTADIYGMGAILYELLTGDPPHDATSVGELLVKKLHHRPVPLHEHRKQKIPVELSALVSECLEVDPTLRPPTALALADRLDAILAGSALPITVPVDPLPEPRRSALLPIGIAIAIVGLVVFTAVLVARGKQATPFADGLTAREQPVIAAPVFRVPSFEVAAAEPHPLATTTEPVDAGMPVEPTRGEAKPRSGRGKQAAPVTAEEKEICDRDRERARNARYEHDWPGVLANTRRASCWTSAIERRRLQVKAYMELGRFGDCIALGKNSTDPEIEEYVTLCKSRRGGK